MPDFFRRTALLPGTAYVVASDAPAATRRMALIEKARFGDLIQICDGVADNVEIQAAINALTAGRTWKEEVFLVGGTFNIGAKIILPSYTIIGIHGKVFAINGLNETMFENSVGVGVGPYTDPGARNTDIEIYGGIIDGNKNNQVGPTDDDNTIHMKGVNNLSLHDLTILNGWTGAIRTTFSSWVTVRDNYIYNSADDGIEINKETSYATVANNHIIDAGIGVSYGASCGIEVQDGAHHITVIGNTIKNVVSDGIQVGTHAGETFCYDITIAANIIQDAGNYGIGIYGLAGQIANHISIMGNTVRSSTSVGIYVTSTVTEVSIIGNALSGNLVGIVCEGPCTSIIGNTVGTGTGGGIAVYATATDSLISGNLVVNNGTVGIAAEASRTVIKSNSVSGNGTYGIYLATLSYVIVEGNNIFNNASSGIILAADVSYTKLLGNITTDNDIGIAIFGDNNDIVANVGTNTPAGAIQRYGIVFYGGADNNRASLNRWYNHTVKNVLDGGLGNILYDQYCDLFMDVLAVSATHVRSNENLGAATPITFTLDAQPDVPRTLSGHFDSHAQITAYTIVITGVDAKGNTVTETFTEAASPWDFETVNAYATITSIIMTARTGTGAGDTMDIGITDVLGLSNKIYATSDVYKIKKNNANALVAVAQVNTTYGTYDMAVIGLAVGDDFTIWFRSNLNIVS